jgi:glycosyltransferase involved in cell wall biosynthesis
MDLSVVVPTLNAETALSDCLDALADVAPDAERIVVDGPSADGTSGMVTERDDVAVLIELADRGVNVARNAGLGAATGDVIAFVDGFTVVQPGWRSALEDAITAGADVVTGPVMHRAEVGFEKQAPEQRRIAGREVTYFDGGNGALTRDLLERLDGFDEYLRIGGARDAAHRVASLGGHAEWAEALTAERAPAAQEGTAYGWKYRSLAYRLAKNYGLRPSIVLQTVRQALTDGRGELKPVITGDRQPSQWLGQGRDVLVNGIRGAIDGRVARLRDRRPARNPNGLSSRSHRAVHTHDWR